jgi:hypothetical protein
MPDAWSSKDERQYEHIKESNEERGMGEDRAGGSCGAYGEQAAARRGSHAEHADGGHRQPESRLREPDA